MYFLLYRFFAIHRVDDKATCAVLKKAPDAESELDALVAVPDLSCFGFQSDLIFVTVVECNHVVIGWCTAFIKHRREIRVLLAGHDTLSTDLLLVRDHPASVLPCALLA